MTAFLQKGLAKNLPNRCGGGQIPRAAKEVSGERPRCTSAAGSDDPQPVCCRAARKPPGQSMSRARRRNGRVGGRAYCTGTGAATQSGGAKGAAARDIAAGRHRAMAEDVRGDGNGCAVRRRRMQNGAGAEMDARCAEKNAERRCRAGTAFLQKGLAKKLPNRCGGGVSEAAPAGDSPASAAACAFSQFIACFLRECMIKSIHQSVFYNDC